MCFVRIPKFSLFFFETQNDLGAKSKFLFETTKLACNYNYHLGRALRKLSAGPWLGSAHWQRLLCARQSGRRCSIEHIPKGQ